MPRVDFLVDTVISRSGRARQLEAMFDVPPADVSRREWHGDLPLDERAWSVGLFVGASGAGKSQVLRRLFGEAPVVTWNASSVVDDFGAEHDMATIADVCSAVGFNTIPAWLRPYAVLSTGERFRVEMARALLTEADPIVIDEFTSVVDRQVAQIGSHAVQKYVRRHGRRFVAATCHYDVIDWLQPDWICEPATMTFQWRSLQRRPAVECLVARVPYATWYHFAPFHYMSADLHRAARCFGLFVGGSQVAFAGMLHRPHPRVRDIMGVSRLVTLPDFQGLGLGPALLDTVAAAYRAVGKRVHMYPAHPALTRVLDRSRRWLLLKRSGRFAGASALRRVDGSPRFGRRPCAVFAYVGPRMADAIEAQRFLAGEVQHPTDSHAERQVNASNAQGSHAIEVHDDQVLSEWLGAEIGAGERVVNA